MHQVDGVAMDPYSIRTTTKMVLIDRSGPSVWTDEGARVILGYATEEGRTMAVRVRTKWTPAKLAPVGPDPLS